MGKTYRSWQKRTPGWQKERHSEQRKKHFGSGRTASISIQERNTTDEHSKCDQEPSEWAGH